MSLLLALGFILAQTPARAGQSEPAGPRVTVGSKAFTESVILGEIISQLAREAGGVVVHKAELGGTQILWKALLAGDIDVYPEYTGTLSQEILAGLNVRGEEAIRQALAGRGVRMSRRLGFNDTYALGMREAEAQKLGIRTISDLAGRAGKLRFGFSEEFQNRQDGWPGLCRRYGLEPGGIRGVDHTLSYKALASGEIDVTDLYSTDAEILAYNLRVLEDDRGYFPVYHAVLVYRADLEERAPQVVEALRALENRIGNQAMVELNARARLEGVRESTVAAEFLNAEMGRSIDVPQTSWAEEWHKAGNDFLRRTREHLFLVVVSLTAAVLVSVPLGVWAYKQPRVGQVILGAVGVIQTLPSLALLVFMIPIPFLGLGERSAVVALFLYSLLPIVRNTYTGLQDIPAHLRESALVLGLPAALRLWRIELPLASRSILAGIKTAAVINVGTATIGAVIGAGGYGQPIFTGIRLDNLGLILQGAVPAALLALLVQGLFGAAERFLVPRGLRIK